MHAKEASLEGTFAFAGESSVGVQVAHLELSGLRLALLLAGQRLTTNRIHLIEAEGSRASPRPRGWPTSLALGRSLKM